jgi:hypothetical protein
MSIPEKCDVEKCVVRVQGRLKGTGFFFRRDGSILTCFHLIGDLKTSALGDEPIAVFYDNQEYSVFIEYCNPQRDIAILRLMQHQVPNGVEIFELAAWDQSKHGRPFRTFGYRPPDDTFNGLHAPGIIEGRIRVQGEWPGLQLASQEKDKESLRPGMSGAPVYIEATRQIVGMITTRSPYDEYHPEIIPVALPVEEAMKHCPLLKNVGFVNREQERNEARGVNEYKYTSRCILFDAPARYGKSELLRVIEGDHHDDNWYCIVVETKPDTDDAIALVRQIIETLDVKPSGKSLEVLYIQFITALQVCVKKEHEHRNGFNGIALFIDDVENLSREYIYPFLLSFLVPFLDETDLGSIRVRMAGSHVGGNWESEARHAGLRLKVIPLSPFRFEYVHNTVLTYRPTQVSSELLAAHIMHITGGHPGCMRTLIDEAVDKMDIEEQFSLNRQKDYYNRVVRDIAHEVHHTIPESLRRTFDNLCVFRRYDLDILRRMESSGYIQQPLHTLIPDLMNTYLIDRNLDNGFYGDNIVRRLLMLRLYWEEYDYFLELCQIAKQIYQEAQSQIPSHNRALITIECLYQELQLAYYSSNPSVEARRALSTTAKV